MVNQLPLTLFILACVILVCLPLVSVIAKAVDDHFAARKRRAL